jgi:hypothetical protein
VTIPAETSETGKEVVITAVWYAEDLRINVPVKHSDPRSGSVTLTVTQVSHPARVVILRGSGGL